MQVETIDAAPLVFDFSNPSAGGIENKYARSATPSAPASLDSPTPDHESIANAYIIHNDDPFFDDDDHEHHHSYIPQEELKHYLEQLKARNSIIIPPVVARGLPALETMNIPNLDREKMKTTPNPAQLTVLTAESLRGPKYLLSFVATKLGYSPPSSNSQREPEESLHSSSTSTLSSSRVSIENGTQTVTPDAQVPDVPVKPASASSSKSVFSRLRTKVTMIRSSNNTALPSPSSAVSIPELQSPPSLSHNARSVSHNTGSVSSASTFSSVKSTGSIPLLAKADPTRHASAASPRAPAIPVSDPYRLQPVSTRMSAKFLPKRSSRKSAAEAAVPRIKSSHKYLHNVGTLQIDGSPAQPFDVIVDPRFPFSFIDMDAIMAETSRAGNREFMARVFSVLATAVYNPESKHNRVVIQVEIVPLVPDNNQKHSTNPSAGLCPIRAPFGPNSESALDWYNESKRIVSLMDIQPYKCILGRDWLAQLHHSTTKAMKAIDLQSLQKKN